MHSLAVEDDSTINSEINVRTSHINCSSKLLQVESARQAGVISSPPPFLLSIL
jgi:hypothetical protein